MRRPVGCHRCGANALTLYCTDHGQFCKKCYCPLPYYHKVLLILHYLEYPRQHELFGNPRQYTRGYDDYLRLIRKENI